MLATATTVADRLPASSTPVVDYTITTTLDASAKTLTAHERLVWRNPSADTVGELWFHLYLNAFKNSASTFFKESGGQLRGDVMPEDGWGAIDITSMKTADGVDLTRAIQFAAPDDGNADDQTVIRVPLPSPVPPGGAITLDIAFTAQLPRVFARTGYARDFFLVGQWFPKIGVYEPAGVRGRTAGGWNCHQFHANTEFYADYGRFDVTFTVPSTYVVGATGERVSERANGDGSTTYRYVQADVHDFAWTADPNYVVREDTFSATNDVSMQEYAQVAALLDRPVDEVMLNDVAIRVLVQPRHVEQAQRYVDAAKVALKWFGLWYGRYPYKTLTVVDPAPAAGGAGGMEYPTFITGGTTVLSNRWPFGKLRLLEEVTVHEFGHQFWYGLVGNNEFEEAWLDEGFNSYSTGKVMEMGYGAGRSTIDVFGFRLGSLAPARLSNSPNAIFERVRQPAWQFGTGAYGFYAYQKPQLLLTTLERFLGEQTMARVMRTYHERWRFRHPHSDDFYAVANEVSGQDLSWYFSQVVEGSGVLDYAVSSVSSTRVKTRQGYTDGEGTRTLVKQEEARKLDRDNTSGPYDTVVMVKRLGGVTMPVQIALKFEGRDVERLDWDGKDTYKRIALRRDERLEWAAVDPDHVAVLDVDWTNNSRRLEPDGRAAFKWSARWVYLVQQFVAFVGF